MDQSQIDVIKAAIADDPTEPILLVGFSQGGMDAQNIAAKAGEYGLQDQIKAVVTFGSPMVQIDRYPAVHLQDLADPVPKFNLVTPTNWLAGIVNSAGNKNLYLHASRNTYDIAAPIRGGIFGVHGLPETYEDIGRFFDYDKSSHWNNLRSAMAAFLNGRVVPQGYTVLNGEIVPKNSSPEF